MPEFSASPTTPSGCGVSRPLCAPCRKDNASIQLLPLLHFYNKPDKPVRGALASTERFRAAVQEAKIGPDKDIPHVTADIIVKYITDLQLLGLL